MYYHNLYSLLIKSTIFFSAPYLLFKYIKKTVHDIKSEIQTIHKDLERLDREIKTLHTYFKSRAKKRDVDEYLIV